MKYSIDWLSGTNWLTRDEAQLRSFMYRITGKRDSKAARAMYGYQYALTNSDGILFESGAREDMGTHIQASGVALTSLMQRSEGMGILMDMIASVVPARIDLAVDSDEAFVNAFAEQAKTGVLITKARAWSVIESQQNGQTVYVGSRSSDQFLRVYNKGAEQGLSDVPWTRIELESKSGAAVAVKGAIRAASIPLVCTTYIRGFCDSDLPQWRAAFDDPAIYYHSVKGKSDTRRWLLDACAPSMRRLIADGDETLFSEFTHKVFD
jgi:hypothetical protein